MIKNSHALKDDACNMVSDVSETRDTHPVEGRTRFVLAGDLLGEESISGLLRGIEIAE